MVVKGKGCGERGEKDMVIKNAIFRFENRFEISDSDSKTILCVVCFGVFLL